MKHKMSLASRVSVTSSVGLNKEVHTILDEILFRACEARNCAEITRDAIKNEMFEIEKAILMVEGILRESQRQDCLRIEKTLVSDVLRAVIDIYKPKLQKYGIKLHFMDVENEPKLLLNSIQMYQAFLNIVANAIDAVSVVDNKEIYVSFEIADQNVVVNVLDTGCGIPDKIKNDVFQPLVTTKTSTYATGLGLAISRQIIRDHGGDITLLQSCQPTHFRINLPILAVNA